MLGEKYDQPCGEKTIDELYEISEGILKQYRLHDLHMDDILSREVYAVLMDGMFDPFNVRPVDHFGNYINN